MDGEHFDASSEPAPNAGSSSASGKRRFVGIQFACCAVYARIYINREGTAYTGNCPRCGRSVRLKIAPGGTDARFFTAY